MRDPRTVPLEQLELEVAELRRRLADAFSIEEMDAIREQLAARAEGAERAREELEWNVRLELARVREAEGACAHAAGEVRRAARSLATLLGDVEDDTDVEMAALGRSSRRRVFA